MSVWLIKCRKVIFFFLILENSGTIHGWLFWFAVSQRIMYIVCFKEMFVCFCCCFLWRLWNYFYRQRQNMCLKCELIIFYFICFTAVKRLRSRRCTEYEKTAILWHVCCNRFRDGSLKSFHPARTAVLIWKHISPLWCSSYSLVR